MSYLRFGVAIGLLIGAAPLAAQTGAVALTNVTVIDGTGAPPRAAMTILIEGSTITGVQPASAALPRGAVVRDLRGRFVIPGLIDSHVHLGTQPRPPGVMESILR